MTDSTADQVMREMDKFERVGVDGLRQRLTTGATDQSGAEIPGVGLHPFQAEAIASFMDGRFGKGLRGASTWFNLVGTRLDLIAGLESTVTEDGDTLWDKLINMPVNDDETWRDGGRPRHIGWALDDIAAVLQEMRRDNQDPPHE